MQNVCIHFYAHILPFDIIQYKLVAFVKFVVNMKYHVSCFNISIVVGWSVAFEQFIYVCWWNELKSAISIWTFSIFNIMYIIILLNCVLFFYNILSIRWNKCLYLFCVQQQYIQIQYLINHQQDFFFDGKLDWQIKFCIFRADL